MSGERVFMAVNHKDPGKVPVDPESAICSTNTAIASGKLKEFLNIQHEQY